MHAVRSRMIAGITRGFRDFGTEMRNSNLILRNGGKNSLDNKITYFFLIYNMVNLKIYMLLFRKTKLTLK